MRRVVVAVSVLACVGVLAAVGIVVVNVLTTGRVPFADGCDLKANQDTIRFDLEQSQHAATIAAIGYQRGLGTRAVTVALATALQESKLENTPGGDRDSIGLFQQRPSQGWGRPEQLSDPLYATTQFYKRLEKVPGWQSLRITDAAQKVQRSAHPEAYQKWEPTATTVANAFSGQAAGTVTCSLRELPAGTSATSEKLRGALRAELGRSAVSIRFGANDTNGTPSLRVALGSDGGGIQDRRRIAYWLVAHAKAYGIASVAYRDVTWQASEGAWKPRPEPDPSGEIIAHFGAPA